MKKSKFSDLWGSLESIENYYKKHHCYYKIIQKNNEYIYFEYIDKKIVRRLIFTTLDYQIFKELEFENLSLDKLHERLTSFDLSIEELKEIIHDYNKEFLVYCSEDFKEIVSIIEF